jgi:hypothetical protein
MTSTHQAQHWCKLCRRQATDCICAKDPKNDLSVAAFRSKFRSCSLPNLNQPMVSCALEPPAPPTGGEQEKPPQPVDKSPTLQREQSWSERLYNPRLAQQLSFLRDERSELLLRGQVVKAVDRAHGALDRQKRRQKE